MFVRTRQPLAAAIGLLVLLLGSSGLTGCSHRSYREAAPPVDESIAGQVLGARPWDGAPRAGFAMGARLLYPLAVGNRWDYAVRSRTTIVTSDGPQPPQFTDDPLRVVISSMGQFGTRTYFFQEEGNPQLGGPFSQVSFLVRQDRSGLYEADIVRAANAATAMQSDAASAPLAPAAMRAYVDRVVARPSERAAFERATRQLAALFASARQQAAIGGPSSGGPDAGEISLLRYPLTAGARWIVRESPRFGRAVVGRERVVVPAGAFMAWDLRGVSELYGPRDRVHFWYSSAGLIRVAFHFESNAVDDAGNVIGRAIGDEEQVLTALNLVDPNGPHTLATAPEDSSDPR